MAKVHEIPVTLGERIDEFIDVHGSLRAAARALDVTPGYLSRLRSGVKDNPTDELLNRMGLNRIVTYERRPKWASK